MNVQSPLATGLTPDLATRGVLANLVLVFFVVSLAPGLRWFRLNSMQRRTTKFALNSVELPDKTPLGLLERHRITLLEVEEVPYVEGQDSSAVAQ